MSKIFFENSRRMFRERCWIWMPTESGRKCQRSTSGSGAKLHLVMEPGLVQLEVNRGLENVACAALRAFYTEVD